MVFVELYGSFAIDALEFPLNVLKKVVEDNFKHPERISLSWKPYACLTLLDFLPNEEISDSFHVFIIRIEDILSPHPEIPAPDDIKKCVGLITRFIDLLCDFVAKCPRKSLLVICPPSPSLCDRMKQFEVEFFDSDHPRWSAIQTHLYILGRKQFIYFFPDYFSVETRYHRERSLLVCHQPYTSDFLCLLAYVLSNAIYRSSVPEIKLFIVDCDHTLWSGAVAEQGPQDIVYERKHEMLQQFLVDAWKRGQLIALCSKNIDEDVLFAFASRNDFHLDLEKHIVQTCCNWRSKVENIAKLLEELNLSSEHTCFIDDNFVECSKVEDAFPMMRIFQFPATQLDSVRAEVFLRHCWTLHGGLSQGLATNEDLARTVLLKEHIQRRTFLHSLFSDQKEKDSDQAIINALQLRVDITRVRPGNVSLPMIQRISQLTQRTNQFNVFSEELSVKRIGEIVKDPEFELCTVDATDRFGNYGLVGVTLSRPDGSELLVQVFLLSCRVLYRKVEFDMLRKLQTLARENQCERIVFRWKRSKRNRPALKFLWALRSGIFLQQGCNDENSIYNSSKPEKIENIEQFRDSLDDQFDAFLEDIQEGSYGTVTFSNTAQLGAVRPYTSNFWKVTARFGKALKCIRVELVAVFILCFLSCAFYGIAIIASILFMFWHFCMNYVRDRKREKTFEASSQYCLTLCTSNDIIQSILAKVSDDYIWNGTTGVPMENATAYVSSCQSISWDHDDLEDQFQQNCTFRRKVRHKAKCILLET